MFIFQATITGKKEKPDPQQRSENRTDFSSKAPDNATVNLVKSHFLAYSISRSDAEKEFHLKKIEEALGGKQCRDISRIMKLLESDFGFGKMFDLLDELSRINEDVHHSLSWLILQYADKLDQNQLEKGRAIVSEEAIRATEKGKTELADKLAAKLNEVFPISSINAQSFPQIPEIQPIPLITETQPIYQNNSDNSFRSSNLMFVHIMGSQQGANYEGYTGAGISPEVPSVASRNEDVSKSEDAKNETLSSECALAQGLVPQILSANRSNFVSDQDYRVNDSGNNPSSTKQKTKHLRLPSQDSLPTAFLSSFTSESVFLSDSVSYFSKQRVFRRSPIKQISNASATKRKPSETTAFSHPSILSITLPRKKRKSTKNKSTKNISIKQEKQRSSAAKKPFRLPNVKPQKSILPELKLIAQLKAKLTPVIPSALSIKYLKIMGTVATKAFTKVETNIKEKLRLLKSELAKLKFKKKKDQGTKKELIQEKLKLKNKLQKLSTSIKLVETISKELTKLKKLRIEGIIKKKTEIMKPIMKSLTIIFNSIIKLKKTDKKLAAEFSKELKLIKRMIYMLFVVRLLLSRNKKPGKAILK